MPWHSTYFTMRGRHDGCDWWTWREFEQLLVDRGIRITRHYIKKALGSDYPDNIHGHKRYREHHLEAVAAYAAANGFTITTEDHADAV